MVLKRLFKHEICYVIMNIREFSLLAWGHTAFKFKRNETSLVAQWIGTRLAKHGARVWSLVQEDSTCLGATKAREPPGLSSWTMTTEARTLEPMSCNYWACVLQLQKHVPLRACALQQEKPARSLGTTENSSPRAPQPGRAHMQQGRPSRAKNKYTNIS